MLKKVHLAERPSRRPTVLHLLRWTTQCRPARGLVGRL